MSNSRSGRGAAGALLALLTLPASGHAQATTADPGAAAQSSPAAGASASDASSAAGSGAPLGPICTDRPTKSDGPCTVDAGHFQYEADIANATFQHTDGVTTDTYLVTDPTLKYGVSSNLDVEASLSPLEVVRTREADGRTQTVAGVGDLYLRVKAAFLNVGGGALQAAIVPYVKVPTARSVIGNGAVEEGAVVPITYKLNDVLSLTTQPEFDDYKDASGTGRHLNTVELISAAVTLPRNVTVFGELWGDWNYDPAGTVRQYSADIAAAYVIGKSLQLDGGLNFGLNSATPGVQAYVGISQRF